MEKAWIGLSVDEALQQLTARGARSAHLVLCRDRKSVAYPFWRVIAAQQGEEGFRLTACSFPRPHGS